MAKFSKMISKTIISAISAYFRPFLGPLSSVIWELKFSKMWDLSRETNNHINFYSNYILAKTNDKIFQSDQKTQILGPFWANMNLYQIAILTILLIFFQFLLSIILQNFRKNNRFGHADGFTNLSYTEIMDDCLSWQGNRTQWSPPTQYSRY